MTGLERESLSSTLTKAIDRLRSEFERSLQTGGEPLIEDYLVRIAKRARPALLRELLKTELELQPDRQTAESLERYRARFPDFDTIVSMVFARHATTASFAPGASTRKGLGDDESDVDSSPAPSPAVEAPPPQQIGRYVVRRRLGHGGFGDVFLAYDSDLARLVALKVPRVEKFSSAAAVDVFLDEARTAARLDHPGIVRVYDVTRETGAVVVIMEYVAGRNLAQTMAAEPLTARQAASLMAQIAEAVNYANESGLMHRDLKPANILIDSKGRPRVADFGLAVQESAQHMYKGEIAGTPAYMPPEQVRGETHRLDGRSDEWSLGVIFYEMLTGQRPFKGETREDLFEEIIEHDPKPPRQIEPGVPSELQRICLKCLAKRMSDRYATVADFAADLRDWEQTPVAAETTSVISTVSATGDDGPKSRIVPKGLRCFDEHDSDFFLELLPGPRDRDGLPEVIRFWKTRIEEQDPDETFAVGLMYGPSGCGKTSLLRAGLLPRLGDHVCPLRIEATADETESRLLNVLRKHYPAIPAELSLPEVFTGLREGHWIPWDTKLLIVIDQFEQWLHAQAGDLRSEFADALRQCDGGRLQALVLVRDDFWMAVTRFFDELEIGLSIGDNVAAVDLFDLRHARRVLAAFGRAHGALRENAGRESPDESRFLDQAVNGLAEGGKVICVHLALFSEMMKGRPWTASSLADVGGTEGVGVTFLEETFGSGTANPIHRRYAQAARAVLHALLPERGTDIKGRMRTREELLTVSGYESRPREFNELMHVLDGELRLITPTDREGDPRVEADGSFRDYQLTHDYLVPALRDWLSRKQRETRRGRAELKLAERASLWKSKPERKQLPSLWEWINIRLFSEKRQWSDTERRMMAKAERRDALRLLILGALAITTWWGVVAFVRWRARLLVNHLRTAEIEKVQGIIADMEDYRPAVNPLLNDGLETAKKRNDSEGRRQELRFRLALLNVEPGRHLNPLVTLLLDAEPNEVAAISPMLFRYKEQLRPQLWKTCKGSEDSHKVLSAAVAIAVNDSHMSLDWDEVSGRIVASLVQVYEEEPETAARWVKPLTPVKAKLRLSLMAVRNGQETNRSEAATALLRKFFPDDPRYSGRSEKVHQREHNRT